MGTLVPKPTLQITVKRSITPPVIPMPIHSYIKKLTLLTNMVTKPNTNMRIAHKTTVKNTFKKNLPKEITIKIYPHFHWEWHQRLWRSDNRGFICQNMASSGQYTRTQTCRKTWTSATVSWYWVESDGRVTYWRVFFSVWPKSPEDRAYAPEWCTALTPKSPKWTRTDRTPTGCCSQSHKALPRNLLSTGFTRILSHSRIVSTNSRSTSLRLARRWLKGSSCCKESCRSCREPKGWSFGRSLFAASRRRRWGRIFQRIPTIGLSDRSMTWRGACMES